MNPIFFGDSQAPLFGVEHPPRGREASGQGIVLCAPMGQEYMRSHRAYRSLANRLARAGHHVLRFDYFGTGDSAGDSHEGTPHVWSENVMAAIDELRESAAIGEVSLVGLRLGAALAACASAKRDDIDRLVLWDPVIDGAAYVAEMLEWGQPSPRGDDTIGVLGFPITRTMREEVSEVTSPKLSGLRARRVRIVVSSADSVAEEFAASLESQGHDARYEVVPAGGRWNEVDNFGGALVPQEILQWIVDDFQTSARSGRADGREA